MPKWRLGTDRYVVTATALSSTRSPPPFAFSVTPDAFAGSAACTCMCGGYTFNILSAQFNRHGSRQQTPGQPFRVMRYTYKYEDDEDKTEQPDRADE